MKKTDQQKIFRFCPEQIDEAAALAEEYLLNAKMERRAALRLRLSMEQVLLSWRAHFGDECEFEMIAKTWLGQPTVRLRVKGDGFDPLKQNEDELTGSAWTTELLSRLQTTPLYSYNRGVNTVTIRIVKPKKSPFVRLLIAVLAALAAAFLGTLFLPAELRLTVANDWLAPFCTTFLNALGLCGIPLIFLSVALGIIGVGDVNTFSRIGRRMVRQFMLILLAAVIGAGVAAFFLFRPDFGSGSTQINVTDILNMILGWVPTGLFTPFIDCNAMQLILLGTIFGIFLLKLAPVGQNLTNTLSDANSLLLAVSEWFTHLIPVFVFIILVRSLWAGQMSQILPAWKSLVITVGLQTVFMAILALSICRKYRVRLGVLLGKISETFLIALGTNSCTASITENYACCAGKLGIDAHVFGFGIPIGTSIFKPACAIRMVILVFYMADFYQIPISASWIALATLMCLLLSVAVPAIPGGVLMFCPMLFAQLGIPAEAVTPMIATDIFFDSICTAFCQVAVSMELVHQAGSMNMLNVELLRKPMKKH